MILFLDVLASFFMVVMGGVGFRRGFIEEMGRLLGLIISTIFALNYYLDLAGLILSIGRSIHSLSWLLVSPLSLH